MSNAEVPAGEARTISVGIGMLDKVMSEGDLHVVAHIDCQALGITDAFLMIEPEKGLITVAMPCGCRVSAKLVPMLFSLAANQARAHGEGGGVH